MSEQYALLFRWESILIWIWDTTERFPKNLRATLSQRLFNLALDVMEKLVEANYNRQRVELLKAVNIDLEKLRILLRLSHNKKLISHRQYEFISRELNEAGKMVGGWVRHETS